MTPHEILRKAAALIRKRAEAATPGPWESLDGGDRLVAWRMDDDFEYVIDEPFPNAANAEHIAMWHPGVALIVADWLDSWAAENIDPVMDALTDLDYALRVARAVLGEA